MTPQLTSSTLMKAPFVRSLCASGALLALAPAAPADQCALPPWEVGVTPDPANATHSIVRDLVAISPSDVWAVGGYNAYVSGQTLTFAFSMHWDGSTWTEVPTPQPSACPSCTNVTLWGIDALGPNDVWACGHKNVQSADGFLGTHILVMHWDGSSWTVMNTPIQNGSSGDILWSVEAIAPNDVWFFGENIYQGPTLPDLAIALHWNGSNFTFVGVPSVNPDTSGFGDGNGLRDGSALVPDDIWAVGAASDGDSMPAGHSQIQHWNGSTWQNVPGPTPGVWHDLDSVAAIAPNDVWACGEYFDGVSYQGLALHYDGASWTQVPIPGGVSDLVAFASDDVYAAGGGIMHWDGTNWTTVESFAQVESATQSGLSAAGPCKLWTGGRFFDGEQIRNFTAHADSDTITNCPSDLDDSGDVGFADLTATLLDWGGCAPSCVADRDHSGDVGFGDLSLLLLDWGACE